MNFETFYTKVTSLLDSIQYKGTQINNDFVQMLSDLDTSEGITDSINRLWFRNTITSNTTIFSNKNFEAITEMRVFVRNLQTYVINTLGYLTIDNYLETFGIKVGTYFASLSEQVGYTINSLNIK